MLIIIILSFYKNSMKLHFINWNSFLLYFSFSFQMFHCKILYLLALLLLIVPLIISLPHHDVHKRSSFFDIECKGVFNKSIFFRLDRICEDCYSLFREPSLHSLCKWVFFLIISLYNPTYQGQILEILPSFSWFNL